MRETTIPSSSEVAKSVDFSQIRYAQCWEDADILHAGLDVQPGQVCLSIASAGDNTLALLAKRPERVIAVDVSPAQLACLDLRVAAYRTLTHPELLELMGSAPSGRREEIYDRCRGQLSPATRHFWDSRRRQIRQGIGNAGRFEHYWSLFRTRLLPLVHRRERVHRLLRGGPREQRLAFYHTKWDSWRWRLLLRVYCSRLVMGRRGRDPRFFRYVEGDTFGRISGRVRHALTEIDPVDNPYLQWLLAGRHLTALPYALRPENFEAIRENLDRLEWHCQPLEDLLAKTDSGTIDHFNLSDIFEYMSETTYHALLEQLIRVGRPGGRLAYWNLFVPRTRPDYLADALQPQRALSDSLWHQDKAFFYNAFVIEEIL